MSRRYKKIKEDMPLLAAKIEDDTPRQVARPSSKTNVIYLLLSTSNSFYLHSIRSFCGFICHAEIKEIAEI